MQKWLNSPEGIQTVRAFVSGKHRHLERPLREYITAEGDAGEEIDVLCQEFSLFLLEVLQDAQRYPELNRLQQEGRFRELLHMVWGRFVWAHADKERDRKNNPRGYLYRRFREFLKHADLFTMCEGGDGCRYFSTSKKEAQQSDAPSNVLETESWGNWPVISSPPKLDREENITVSRRWLSETAEFFLAEAGRRYPDCQWFALHELIRYLCYLHPWLNRPQPLPFEDTGSASFSSFGKEDHIAGFERRRQLSTICSLGSQLIESWERIQCCIFAWRMEEPPRTFEKIAQILGLQGVSGTYASYQRSLKALKEFCSTWPGPALSEMERDIGETFLEKVIDLAKSKCGRP